MPDHVEAALHEMLEGRDSEIGKLRQALADILNPLAYLERQAKAEGATLNSLAPSIANNIGTLQGIARDALKA